MTFVNEIVYISPTDSFRSTTTAPDAYVSVPTVGDPSSAKWVSSNEELLAMDDFREQDKDKYVTVYYAAVNDRDILNNNGECSVPFYWELVPLTTVKVSNEQKQITSNI